MKGKLSISRVHCTGGEGHIEIQVEDEISQIQFLRLEISPADFAEAVTGLSSRPCELKVNGLENVGKAYEWKPLDFPMPEGVDMYGESRRQKAIEEMQKHVPEGWEGATYFGAQDSFYKEPDGTAWARTRIYRWVDAEQVG